MTETRLTSPLIPDRPQATENKTMSIRYLLTAVLLAGGCVGDLTPVADDGDDDGVSPDAGGGGGGGVARQMFERDVFPILTAKCGAGCHLTTSSSSTPERGVRPRVVGPSRG